jgi:hypothetical protein
MGQMKLSFQGVMFRYVLLIDFRPWGITCSNGIAMRKDSSKKRLVKIARQEISLPSSSVSAPSVFDVEDFSMGPGAADDEEGPGGCVGKVAETEDAISVGGESTQKKLKRPCTNALVKVKV